MEQKPVVYEELELENIAFDHLMERLKVQLAFAERHLGKGKISTISTTPDNLRVWIKKHRG